MRRLVERHEEKNQLIQSTATETVRELISSFNDNVTFSTVPWNELVSRFTG